ncbi:superoxide dismutase [Lysobacteraceae bacterium NML120232]|nr:superoxide dismutase [Xanthomonadaceae bacterium NML08-0793]PJK12441.1 superoxide dismutase [Xanthomonadaceae bacterium NML120232]
MKNRFKMLLPMAVLTMAACAHTAGSNTPAASAAVPPGSAVVKLQAKSGSQVGGELHLHAEAGGVRLQGKISGLDAGGEHAFHIHEKGDCSAADGSSAGGHFNPTAQPHGRSAHGAHHLGDQDNLRANAEGMAEVNAFFPGVSLGDGAASDVAGKAVIIHAGSDDYTSQPTGNAGGRIACGVVVI